METKRAIDILKCFQEPEAWEKQITEEAFNALQMVIDVLSDEGDTISRAKAIEALDKRFDSIPMEQTSEILMLRKDLRELPPAQPAQTAPDQNGDLWITVPDIDEVTCIYVQESKSKFCRIFYEGQEQPERIKGHWIESNGLNKLMKKFIEKGETWRVCDKCGAGFMIGYQYECDKLYHETFHNFCPKCGADMREVTE